MSVIAPKEYHPDLNRAQRKRLAAREFGDFRAQQVAAAREMPEPNWDHVCFYAVCPHIPKARG